MRTCLHSKGNLLLHDEARPNFAAATVEAVGQLKFELLRHPHIARAEIQRIITFLDHERKPRMYRRFASDVETKARHTWGRLQPKTFWQMGSDDL